MQADPLGLIDEASVYVYAGQSPMMNMDPTGQCFGPAAVWCARAAWFGFFRLIDVLLDEDCYTLSDFGLFALDYFAPGPAVLCGPAGKGGGSSHGGAGRSGPGGGAGNGGDGPQASSFAVRRNGNAEGGDP